jgi:uncharacterized membrane-anchored protein YitT (DUF2179 family)
MSSNIKDFRSAMAWNLFLITIGALLFSLGLKTIAVSHGFITGGISGISLLLYYFTDMLSPGLWYFLINIPLFIIGWLYVSRRFFYYSAYGMIVCSLAMDLFHFTIDIREPMLAALAGGVIMGAGSGITFHSLGSLGGLDILGVILNRKLNLRIGTFFLIFNMVVFTFSFGVLEIDLILLSLGQTFVAAQMLNYVLSVFNQRKMVLIISDRHQEVAEKILDKVHHGLTYLNGSGAYSGQDKKIVLAVVNNYELKRLEDIVLGVDTNALMIMENTFNVLGKGFSKPKVY